MTPTTQPYGDKWILRSIRIVDTTRTVGGRTTAKERTHFWTGSEWHDSPGQAKAFDSRKDASQYLEANRDTLEP